MAYKSELHGVGGWLAFFIFVLGVSSPASIAMTTWAGLYGDGETAYRLGQSWVAVQIAEWAFAGLHIALRWWLVWLLFQRQTWRSVQIVIIFLWTLPTAFTLLDFLVFGLITGSDLGPMLARMFDVSLIGPFFAAGIWTAYLMKSQRVANTYPRYDAAGLSEVFD